MFSCGKGIVIINIVIFLYKIGDGMLDATTRPYLIHGVCYKILGTVVRENETACSSLDKYPALEDEVQKQSGYYLIYYRLLLNIPAILLSMFCGSYSDRHGRKLPILLPCFGGMAAVMMYLASNMLSEHRVQMILGGAAMQGMFGKSSLINMAANSIVFDFSNCENRTRNFGKLLAMNFLGGTLGALMSGVFQDLLDINTTFVAIMILYIIAISLVFLLQDEDEKKTDTLDPKTNSFCQVFKVGHIKETVAVITKSRSGNNRKLNLSDVNIVIIGLISMFAKVIFLAFSTTSWMVFVSLGMGAFIGMAPSTLRSLLSKTLNEDEAGKVFSILSCGETISKFLGSLIFVNIYGATAHIFRGITYITETFIVLIMLVIVLVKYRQLQHLQSSLDNVTVVIDNKNIDQRETQSVVDNSHTQKCKSENSVYYISV
uniref:Proton-coupled folate transporter-like n=1 Tax=Crassostrea virginica TaxID=6565 RepID=A0A8B8CHF2_CRAVI|nr:proton-coupled folate transporter-like [Crassostrea virginica]